MPLPDWIAVICIFVIMLIIAIYDWELIMSRHLITFFAISLLIAFLFLGYYQFKISSSLVDIADSILHAGVVLLLWNYLMSRT